MGSVSLTDVRKVYGFGTESELVAVEGLDLHVEDGEFLVLVGPSGCGKSTTLRMIAGLEEVTEGVVEIDGVDVTDEEPKDRDIAMVFQNYALYPHKTVRENIGFGLKYSSDLSREAIDERVRDVAEMMGITSLLDDKPSQLSGGQRQRVALGRAIVREPEAFLFDEPLSNLDAKLRTHMRTEIAQLQDDLGVTTVYVTHDQAEAMTMGDRIAVLNDGRLQQVGTPHEVYDHPANEFVAGFIGSPSMNFLPVRVERQAGRTMLVGRTEASIDYALDEEMDRQLPVEPGTDATIGVRPEDVHVVRDPAEWDAGRLVDATVEVVEPMGSDNFLSLDIGADEAWVARVDSSYTPNVGQDVAITFDFSSLHVFAADGTTVKSQGTGEDAIHAEAPAASH